MNIRRKIVSEMDSIERPHCCDEKHIWRKWCKFDLLRTRVIILPVIWIYTIYACYCIMWVKHVRCFWKRKFITNQPHEGLNQSFAPQYDGCPLRIISNSNRDVKTLVIILNYRSNQRYDIMRFIEVFIKSISLFSEVIAVYNYVCKSNNGNQSVSCHSAGCGWGHASIYGWS